ncbi:hypothetical protein [Anaerovorax odorimutans]|nr:hypothetical protein [Anaerovorax odorimutans]
MEDKEFKEKIKKFDDKVIHYLFTIAVSMFTAMAVTFMYMHKF